MSTQVFLLRARAMGKILVLRSTDFCVLANKALSQTDGHISTQVSVLVCVFGGGGDRGSQGVLTGSFK